MPTKKPAANPSSSSTKPARPIRLHCTDPFTSEEANFLYTLYKTLYDTLEGLLSLAGKYRTFETAAVHIRPCPITHISRNALVLLVEQCSTKGLRRGHSMMRRARGEVMFNEPALPRDQMLKFFLDNDKVTLITKWENARHETKHWSQPLIKVPDNILVNGSYAVAATPGDLDWARDELAKLAAQP